MLCSVACWLVPSFPAEPATTLQQGQVEMLFKLAQEHQQAGQIDDAIHELRKLLLIDPWNEQARRTLAELESVKHAQREQRERAIQDLVDRMEQRAVAAREQAIAEALEQAQGKVGLRAAPTPELIGPPSGPPPPEGIGRSAAGGGAITTINQALAPLAISGQVRAASGITRDDVIVQEANGDLNERNFRIFSGPFRYNTFDPRVFSRLRLNLDTTEDHGWQFHSNTTVDPWSFVGTTDRVTVVGATPTDSVEVQLKWWSPTNTAINETFLTLKNGDSLATPEIEASEGRTIPTSVSSTFGNTFPIPALEIDYTFQPIRWLWTGYRSDTVDFRIFPLALEDQALTSDDPLHLSNHHIYWEPSPWLDEWKAGRLNPGATPDDFSRGTWSDDLTFFTRDSDLTRLTALRGSSLQWHPAETTTLQMAIASPKGLWQDYESFNSLVGMARLKQSFWDGRLRLGGLYTTRWGFRERHRDATNHVYSIDGSISPIEGTTLSAQAATSQTIQDRTNVVENDVGGWAWRGAVTTAWWGERLTSRLFYTHMNDSFDPGLANYRHTRQDQFWGRHLRLKRRLKVLEPIKPIGSLTWDEIRGVRIGDGVDVGRDALGLRLSGAWWDGQFKPLVDVRNVHTTEGKYVETVVRNENSLRPTSWLTMKTLVLYHDLPRTTGGIDPFVVNADTGRRFDNATIVDGRDPSLQAYSLGAELSPGDDYSIWAVWERTNDTTLGTGNFPRGLLDGASFGTREEEGSTIRVPTNFLFGQGFFPQPPYPFFDIYRAGAYYAPWDPIEFAVDWTRNEFEYAGQIDDNLNHIGFTTAWSPTKRVTLVARYVASWAIDITNTNASGGNKFASHHSLYGWFLWKPSDDAELSLEYGVSAVGAPNILFSTDPEGDYYPTLDTEHLIRLLYTVNF